MGDVYQDNLVTLKELKNFKVADGDADVRGWKVTSADGIKVGKVDELVIDREAMKVRYLDLHLNKDIFDREVDRHLLIPVGIARINRDNDRVMLDETTVSDLLRVPPYAPGPITREYERSVRNSLISDSSAPEKDEGFYEHDHFDSDRFYNRRRDDASVIERP